MPLESLDRKLHKLSEHVSLGFPLMAGLQLEDIEDALRLGEVQNDLTDSPYDQFLSCLQRICPYFDSEQDGVEVISDVLFRVFACAVREAEKGFNISSDHEVKQGMQIDLMAKGIVSAETLQGVLIDLLEKDIVSAKTFGALLDLDEIGSCDYLKALCDKAVQDKKLDMLSVIIFKKGEYLDYEVVSDLLIKIAHVVASCETDPESKKKATACFKNLLDKQSPEALIRMLDSEGILEKLSSINYSCSLMFLDKLTELAPERANELGPEGKRLVILKGFANGDIEEPEVCPVSLRKHACLGTKFLSSPDECKQSLDVVAAVLKTSPTERALRFTEVLLKECIEHTEKSTHRDKPALLEIMGARHRNVKYAIQNFNYIERSEASSGLSLPAKPSISLFPPDSRIPCPGRYGSMVNALRKKENAPFAVVNTICEELLCRAIQELPPCDLPEILERFDKGNLSPDGCFKLLVENRSFLKLFEMDRNSKEFERYYDITLRVVDSYTSVKGASVFLAEMYEGYLAHLNKQRSVFSCLFGARSLVGLKKEIAERSIESLTNFASSGSFSLELDDHSSPSSSRGFFGLNIEYAAGEGRIRKMCEACAKLKARAAAEEAQLQQQTQPSVCRAS